MSLCMHITIHLYIYGKICVNICVLTTLFLLLDLQCDINELDSIAVIIILSVSAGLPSYDQ